ncbi:hypothetical protein KEM48_004332 [Puccinia striiformis f. sp. tritici PST-130]|nr:hypothetical protein KEM48_004332 [Puccinia striiformis f. sp. tritici PST-130]
MVQSLKVMGSTQDTDLLTVNIKDTLRKFPAFSFNAPPLQIAYDKIHNVCAFTWAVQALPNGGPPASCDSAEDQQLTARTPVIPCPIPPRGRVGTSATEKAAKRDLP